MPGRRRIPVQLDLDARGYITNAVQVTEATKAMDAEMGALDREVDKVDRDLAELAVTTEAAKEQVDDLGDKSRGTAADLALLDGRIKATKLSVRELGLEFARTGDKAAGTAVGKERSLLARLERLRKELSDLEEQVKTTAGVGITLPGRGAMSLVAPAIIGALPAVPALGAMIAGALTGAGGTAAVAAGIVSTFRNERVQAAARDAGNELLGEFFRGGDTFAGPVMAGLDELVKGFKDMHVPEALEKVAPMVQEMAAAFADAGREFMPGFNTMLDRMGPFADVAAGGIVDLGAALGDFLDSVSNSEGSLDGLQTLFHALTVTIRGTGDAVEFLADAYEFMLGPSEEAAKWLENIYGWLPPLRDLFHRNAAYIDEMRQNTASLNPHLERMSNVQIAVNQGLDPFIGYMKDATREVNNFAGALTELFQGQLDIDHATLAWNQDILALKESVQEHGHSLSDNTEEGLRNQQMIQGLIEDAMAVREATKEQTGSTDAANEAYKRQIDILKALLEKLGFTKQQIDGLVGNYEVNVRVHIGVEGGNAAKLIANLKLEDKLAGRAAGGPLIPGVPYVFGEQGPEFGVFGQPGQMYSNAQSMAMARQWSGASGGSRYVIENHITLVDPMTGAAQRKTLITDAVNRGVPQAVVAAAYP